MNMNSKINITVTIVTKAAKIVMGSIIINVQSAILKMAICFLRIRKSVLSNVQMGILQMCRL